MAMPARRLSERLGIRRAAICKAARRARFVYKTQHQALEQIADWRGYPEYVRVDNGPEFISGKLAAWAERNNVIIDFIEPGKPAQNAYIERFNRTYREDVLDMYLFRTLTEVRELSSEWSYEYNSERPHESLNNMTPYEYLQTFT